MNRVSLAGWRRIIVEGGVMLVHPEPSVGFIRVRAREPLRPLPQVLAECVAAGIGGLPAELVDKPRVVGTNEGEFAALAELVARAEGRELRRYLGLVAGDEYAAIVDGRVARADEFARFADLVERMTLAHSMGLGSDRWRRFYYRPPRGWDGVARHRADVWLAPDYPRNPGMITVFHARPERATRTTVQHARLFEDLTAEFGVTGPSEPTAIQTASGLMGQTVFFEGQTALGVRRVANAGFADGRYAYVMRLETDDAHREVNTDAFVKVYRSVEALPWPRQHLDALVHWTD